MKTLNPILENVLKNRINYCHVIEVNNTYEIECIIESIIDENENEYGLNNCIEFLTSLQIYCLDDENENEIFAFDVENYINENYL